ncbi:MAG: ABC transporter permease/M1 family aminopeptidase [Mariniblastus sp.]
MFQTFFGFELRYWLKGVMVYIFLFIIMALVLGAMSTDDIVIGQAVENTNRNAPFVIQMFYSIMWILTCLMTTAFVNDAASRDFAHKSSQLIFTKPISKLSYLMGRFWGAVLVALIPMLGVSIGIIVSKYMPWNEPSRFGEVYMEAHFWGLVAFAIPNAIFISAIIFGISIWLRSTFASFIGIILLLVAYGFSQSLVGNLDNEVVKQLADPFGLSVFQTQTKYWTLAERNVRSLTFGNSMLLWNRLIWVAVSLVIFGIACARFTFAERVAKKTKKSTTPIRALPENVVSIPKVSFNYGLSAQLRQFWSQFKVDFFGTIKSPVFLVIVFAGMLDIFFSLQTVASEGFGLSALPVTYQMIEVIQASLLVYLSAVIVFYAGILVWKERDAKLDEVYDALPHSTWISYTAKLFSILAIVLIVLFAEALMGILNQALAGYYRFQLGLYAKELLLISFGQLFAFTVLAFMAHIFSPNKYVGYFVFVIFVIANLFVWDGLSIDTHLVKFASMPGYVYSDLFQFAPFVKALAWFGSYWVLFCVFLSCIGILFWQRGRERGFLQRLAIGRKRFAGKMAFATISAFTLWFVVGGWIFYNTNVLNTYRTSSQTEKLSFDYETKFKTYEGMAQPRINSVKFDIEIFPHKRGLILKGVQEIENKTEAPIESLIVNFADGYETELTVENAELSEEFVDFNFKIYKFDPPLAPGATSRMNYTVSYFSKGFENEISQMSIVQNGSFFNNELVPKIGYQKSFELSNKNDRKKFGLEPNDVMPPLDPENMTARKNTYLGDSSDWVDVETVISTSDDQIAVAPGSLVEKWSKDGRRYFRYKVDHQSLNMYSFVSADYKVAHRRLGGIDIEVYYHPEHEWNVDKMLRSVRKSLEYFTAEFGPYEHKQARIIEFPRTSTFAQAFPGTMPYSEGIGFIADIKNDDDIDMVYYVVAHEMAHQWWAHQVMGADMLGATLLSETLAQYSSLMVMEKEYGRDIMRKFMRYEMDSYLSSRGRELLEERPLVKVASGQGYIHYRKGSVVMYYLKEMIGEEKINAALRSLIKKFAYKTAPYPTSVDLVEALKEQTPPDLHYLLKDLFEEITLFENRVLETSYTVNEDGKYDVTVEIECGKYQADKDGNQEKIAINDWVEIGAFAKPEKGRKYGETLHREKVKVVDEKSTYTFVVDEEPVLAGVDPFNLLIDRLPEDNLKKPVKK